MLLTEEEAREKVCPQCMDVESENLNVIGCIASDCMAWRWGKLLQYTVKSTQAGTGIPGTEVAINEVREPKGYCGLAGKVDKT